MAKYKKVDQVLRILLAVYAIVVAVLLASAAITIYLEGTAPENVIGNGVYVHPVYSPEIVAQHFKPIAGIVYGFFGFVLLVILFHLFGFQPNSDSIKDLPSRKVPVHKTMEEDTPASVKSQKVLRIILYVLAIGLVIWGITNGGMRDVLFKAITICTECIGLG